MEQETDAGGGRKTGNLFGVALTIYIHTTVVHSVNSWHCPPTPRSSE